VGVFPSETKGALRPKLGIGERLCPINKTSLISKGFAKKGRRYPENTQP